MAFVKYQKVEKVEPVKASDATKLAKKLACKCDGSCSCAKK